VCDFFYCHELLAYLNEDAACCGSICADRYILFLVAFNAKMDAPAIVLFPVLGHMLYMIWKIIKQMLLL
jgi:hypothetical protein